MKHRKRKPPSASYLQAKARWAALPARREAAKERALELGRLKTKEWLAANQPPPPGYDKFVGDEEEAEALANAMARGLAPFPVVAEVIATGELYVPPPTHQGM